MFDCIKQGLGYLRDRCDAALIVPVDLALCSVQTVRALAAARGSVCVPAYQGRNGHPILLRGDCFDALCAYTGPDGLGGAIYHAGLDRTVVPVDDAGILADVQHTPEARRLPGTQELQKLCPEVEITLCKEQPFFGPQTLQLLQLTQETGSLLAACRRVGISYSKGRGMIAAAEAQLGGALLARQQGGCGAAGKGADRQPVEGRSPRGALLGRGLGHWHCQHGSEGAQGCGKPISNPECQHAAPCDGVQRRNVGGL